MAVPGQGRGSVNPGDTCTPVYGLPYATGASKPCNIGDTMCDFSEAVETQLDALDTVVSQLQNAPFAYMLSSVQQDYNNSIPGAFIPTFDTTLADTDNMIDLALDPTALYIKTAGVYSFFVEMDVLIATGGTSLTTEPIVRDANGSQIGGNFTFQTSRFVGPTGMPLKSNGLRLANVAFTAEFIANVGVNYSYSFQVTVGGPSGTISNIQTCRAGATWLRGPL